MAHLSDTHARGRSAEHRLVGASKLGRGLCQAERAVVALTRSATCGRGSDGRPSCDACASSEISPVAGSRHSWPGIPRCPERHQLGHPTPLRGGVHLLLRPSEVLHPHDGLYNIRRPACPTRSPVRLPPALSAALQQAARGHGVSPSALVRTALHQFLSPSPPTDQPLAAPPDAWEAVLARCPSDVQAKIRRAVDRTGLALGDALRGLLISAARAADTPQPPG